MNPAEAVLLSSRRRIALIVFLTMLALPTQAKPLKSNCPRTTAEGRAVQGPSAPSAGARKTDFPVNQDAAHSSPEKSDVYGALLLALSAIEGLLFAMLGVVVQVGPARSLRMLSKVFPITQHVAIPMGGLSLQALFLLQFNTAFIPKPLCAYLMFVINLVIIGIIAVRAIRALDPIHVVDGALDWYFNE